MLIESVHAASLPIQACLAVAAIACMLLRPKSITDESAHDGVGCRDVDIHPCMIAKDIRYVTAVYTGKQGMTA